MLADHHRDPFDRMLVAQAISEPLRLITSDGSPRRITAISSARLARHIPHVPRFNFSIVSQLTQLDRDRLYQAVALCELE